ncbi:carbamoyl-phosphate synthase large subunit [Mollicutes bacterium LVI A0039]|nr:carbamoyl-phosphate synthase large subunit [Mollicutes bacterium LVI A0039]
MPKNKSIKKVLVIGSGPIVIGQAAEFDYAGVQACLALKEEGIEVVLVNSNPATIMTDTDVADKVYIEPLTIEFLERVIRLEKPDSLLPTLGGQTGLNLALELDSAGILAENNVNLIGVNVDSINKAEDRELFKNLMNELELPIPASTIANTAAEAHAFASEIGFPVIIRPAFTLGGSGGGIANNIEELEKIVTHGLDLSPVTQVLIEQSIKGYKEIEYEVICDNKGQAIVVCNMENIDPVGVHTGDSIVVAPSQTLTDREYHRLRTVSLDIIKALGIAGGCNVQLAQDPNSSQFYIIEVNPRVSRSSALASKATGYPIAKISTLIAIGYNLDEIKNPITKDSSAAVEPALDYVALKFARLPFDKLKTNDNRLSTQMQATGEILAIDTNLEAAFLKAIRSLEVKNKYFAHPKFDKMSIHELSSLVTRATDEQIFQMFAMLRQGFDPLKLAKLTEINKFFVFIYKHIIDIENNLIANKFDIEVLKHAKKYGFADEDIARFWETTEAKVREFRQTSGLKPVYKMIDTCAAEFASSTSYFYSAYASQNESNPESDKQKIVVLGSGPIRIGQGIEFDYATVHCIKEVQANGYEAVVINNNPETVSTDFALADKLYIAPMVKEDVLDIIEHEKPVGVIVQFGGQTAINLCQDLTDCGIKILGTQNADIDRVEDREEFEAGLRKIEVLQPQGKIVNSLEEATLAAQSLEYPVLVRPSFVLGGEAMKIISGEASLVDYFENLDKRYFDKPILVDKYVNGMELEVDAVCDGSTVFIPGLIEHIESSGVHSGDSMAVYPPQRVTAEQAAEVVEITEKIAKEFKVLGLMNIQFIIDNGKVFVIEVNPRASRTVPFLVKTTKHNIVKLATNVILGKKLIDLGIDTKLAPNQKLISVKAPVFSFNKIHMIDNLLGPEMKSTGEVMGTDISFEKALYKAFLASNTVISHKGGVLLTASDTKKASIVPIAKLFSKLGFELYATKSTASYLREHGLKPTVVARISDDSEYTIKDLFAEGKLNYVLNVISNDSRVLADEVTIRNIAISQNIPCFSSIDTVSALLKVLVSQGSMINAI